MKSKIYLFGILAASLIFINTAEAKLRKSTYVKEVSKIDWQLLSWTAAWRGTTKPADPFILERMEYKGSKETKKRICIYLNGDIEQATDENLKKSVDSTLATIRQDFPEIDKGDLFVQYDLESKQEDNEGKEKKKYMTVTYDSGSFTKSAISDSPDVTTSASPSY